MTMKRETITTVLALTSALLAACNNPKASSRREADAPPTDPYEEADPPAPPAPADEQVADPTPPGEPPGPEVTPPPPAPKPEIHPGAALRSYDQIYATMSVLTGVPATNATMRAVYTTSLSTSLPTENTVKGFVASSQVAIFKLAVEYCDALINDQALRAQVFGTFDFAQPPATALNAAGKQALADALVTRFWGKDMDSLPPHAESTAMAVAIMDEILTGKTATNAAVTPVVAKAACSAVLASAPVMFY